MGKVASGAILVADNGRTPGAASKIVRARVIMESSPKPSMRPLRAFAPEEEDRLLAMSADILNVVAASNQEDSVFEAAQAAVIEAAAVEAVDPAQTTTVAAIVPAGISNRAPTLRPTRLQLSAVEPTSAPIATTVQDVAPEVVTRMSTSGNRHWGINIGTYGSEYEARKILLKTALTELDTLDGALRKVVKSNRGYNANFLGLTEDIASLTCRKLEARGGKCSMIGPS
jgi:D-alanyl-D-alanine carboxypeptidase